MLEEEEASVAELKIEMTEKFKMKDKESFVGGPAVNASALLNVHFVGALEGKMILQTIKM